MANAAPRVAPGDEQLAAPLNSAPASVDQGSSVPISDEKDRRARTRLLTALGLAGTFLMGSLSNGFWDSALKPFLGWIGRSLLTLSASLVYSYKTRIYEHISRGMTEYASSQMLTVVLVFVCSFPIVVLLFAKIRRSRTAQTRTNARAKKNEVGSWDAFFDGVFHAAAVLQFVLGALLMSERVYVHNAIAHFNQMMTICAPHLSEDGEKAIRSKFAQMTSASDFEQILDELYHVAQHRELKTPVFTVW